MNAPLNARPNLTPSPLDGTKTALEPMVDAIYLRVSTGQQTLEQQLASMKYFLDFNGIDLNDVNTIVYEEDATSATKNKRLQDRTQGSQLWNLIHAGHVKRLVVVDYDRLWRDGVTGVVEMTAILSKGVEVLATMAGMALDLTTSDGFQSFWNKMGQAQAECMRVGERVKRKQGYNLQQGQAITGKVYGWNTVKKTGQLNPNYEEQAVIAWVEKELSGKHGRSQAGCAAYLNRVGIKSKNGGKWYPSGMPRIVNSKTQIALKDSIKPRYVQHPILGKVRIGPKQGQAGASA